ncbi:MAG TPA: hypothetical protein VF017_03130 [Thermoanaerobaculia bacterium]|nr:hypothetical protein [Thermoanaerobaculia bacterium]
MKRWLPVTGLALLGLSPALAAESPLPAPPGFGETLEVQLLNVPFFAFDQRDRPILDLREEEVELLIDGAPVSVDSFDGTAHRPSAGTAPSLDEVRFAPPPRHLVLLIDQAFQSPGSLRTTRKTIATLLAGAAPTDQLHLLVFDAGSGLRTLVTGVPAARAETVLLQLETIEASNLLTLNAGSGIENSPAGSSSAGGRGALGVPSEQIHFDMDVIRASGLGQYRGAAESLASAFDALAGHLGSMPGTKLLAFFSDGPSSELFFGGDDGLMAGSGPGLYHVRARYQTPLLDTFERPLARLAEAGIVTLFINPLGASSGGRDSLRHFGEAAGGLYAEGPDANFLGRRLQAVTAAYYEVGTYHDKARPAPALAAIEIRIRRPGVRAQVLAAPHDRRGPRSHPELGGKDWVAALVHRGPEALPPARQASGLQQIPGRVAGRRLEQGTGLVFEPTWTELATAGTLEVYDVLLAVRPGQSRPEVRHFQRIEAGDNDRPGRFETTLPGDGAAIWGIVAVETATGRTWYRRLLLEVPKPATQGEQPR